MSGSGSQQIWGLELGKYYPLILKAALPGCPSRVTGVHTGVLVPPTARCLCCWSRVRIPRCVRLGPAVDEELRGPQHYPPTSWHPASVIGGARARGQEAGAVVAPGGFPALRAPGRWWLQSRWRNARLEVVFVGPSANPLPFSA